jgi:hypothetical protein
MKPSAAVWTWASVVGLAFGQNVAGSAARAPQQRPAVQDVQRLEGAWVRRDTEGAGSWDGLGKSIPPAQIKPEAAAAGMGRGARGAGGGGRGARGAPIDTTPHAEGDPYIVTQMPCGSGGGRGGGALLINPDSGGVHFVVSDDEVIFAGERGGVRHIYLDGRPHPSPWAPTGAGHSVGHFEGNVLVVDTTGLTAGAVPGNGLRGPNTHLTERFEVAADGKSMTVTYTWDDPAIYVKPQTYQYVFDRSPGNPPYALEEWCDASDPIEKQSIVPPKQIIKN